MSIKNIRQFNSILSSVANVEQHYSDLLSFAVAQIERHGNKDPLLTFANSSFIRTKQGKVKSAYKPLIRWINAACPALAIGQRVDNKVTKFTADNLPLALSGINVIFDSQKSSEVTPYTEWLESQAADKPESAPASSVSANSLVKYLQGKLQLKITAADISELDALAQAAKALLAACASIDLPQIESTAMDSLSEVKPSAVSKAAGNKKAA